MINVSKPCDRWRNLQLLMTTMMIAHTHRRADRQAPKVMLPEQRPVTMQVTDTCADRQAGRVDDGACLGCSNSAGACTLTRVCMHLQHLELAPRLALCCCSAFSSALKLPASAFSCVMCCCSASPQLSSCLHLLGSVPFAAAQPLDQLFSVSSCPVRLLLCCSSA